MINNMVYGVKLESRVNRDFVKRFLDGWERFMSAKYLVHC